jgi:hypothetical protein
MRSTRCMDSMMPCGVLQGMRTRLMNVSSGVARTVTYFV